MIRSIHCSGAPETHLPSLPIWGRRFEFGPGLNVIFGPNGCGKTTLAKILGALTSLANARSALAEGFPDLGAFHDHPLSEADHADKGVPFSTPYFHDLLLRELLNLPSIGSITSGASASFRRGASIKKDIEPKALSVALDWDGAASSFISGSSALQKVSAFSGVEDMREELRINSDLSYRSSGEAVFGRLGRMLERAVKAQVPYFSASALSHVNHVWQRPARSWNAWVDEVKKTSKPGSPTLILDEPDLSMSLLAQSKFWPGLARWADTNNTQVIAVSHSPFALASPRVIDASEAGYTEDVRGKLLILAAALIKPQDPEDIRAAAQSPRKHRRAASKKKKSG